MFQLQTDASFPVMAVSAVLDQILSTGQIVQKDAYRILQAGMTLETSLSAEEEAKIRTIFYRLELGVLKVTY